MRQGTASYFCHCCDRFSSRRSRKARYLILSATAFYVRFSLSGSRGVVGAR
jgi:hypothetical protein